jgi:hypothetical protein
LPKYARARQQKRGAAANFRLLRFASLGGLCFTARLMRPLLLLLLAASLGGCSLFHSEEPAKKKGFSLWPFGAEESTDATPYLEYRRTLGKGEAPLYTLTARNAHISRKIVGQVRTTLETESNETKVESESFTLAPNEEKQILVYPANKRVTYEVTAFFQD